MLEERKKEMSVLEPSELAASAPSSASGTVLPRETKPNILYFLADDIGLVYRPWNEQSPLDAPNIADLAEHGTVFTQMYSDCALCAPSRYATLTGNHAHRGGSPTGVWSFGPNAKHMVRDGQRTLGEMLQVQGYATYFAGKWHLGGGGRSSDDPTRLAGGPIDFGFNDSRTLWRGLGEAPHVLFDHDRDRPSADAPPYQDYSPCHPDMSEPAMDFAEPSPLGWSSMVDWDHADRWVSAVGPCLASWARRTIKNAPTPFFLYYASASAHAPFRPPVRFLDKGPVRGVSNISNIADMMLETDRALGTLVKALQDRSLLASTIIVFTSDNGQVSTGNGQPICDDKEPSY